MAPSSVTIKETYSAGIASYAKFRSAAHSTEQNWLNEKSRKRGTSQADTHEPRFSSNCQCATCQHQRFPCGPSSFRLNHLKTVATEHSTVYVLHALTEANSRRCEGRHNISEYYGVELILTQLRVIFPALQRVDVRAARHRHDGRRVTELVGGDAVQLNLRTTRWVYILYP